MTGRLSVVVAGGGTAGHIEPALAVADTIKQARPQALVTALGTPRGLEGALVPARGYPLELVPAVPLPRKPSRDLATVPSRLAGAVRAAASVLDRVQADVLVGFGGYVAVPAYLAARRRKIPIVVHEANAKAGIANRLGARFADQVFTASGQTRLKGGTPVGVPVRQQIAQLDRAASRASAREHFGLDPHAPTLLVFGGSQGARALNEAVVAASARITAAGVQILHAKGPNQTLSAEPSSAFEGRVRHVVVDYLTRMDLAYAAADLALCRSGAMTVAEVSAVGLPSVFVPLPHGNGEQALNALDLVAAGGGLLVPEAELTADRLGEIVRGLLCEQRGTGQGALARMAESALRAGSHDTAEVIVRAVLALAEGARRG
ncbi:UDP-N-acetylglucosamine--N-acetylmuramyl- (pentapeptide) pyrophosphoryl-undecaprenol N- acetylglucosamine transferase [Segniliparus rotundus DSM 44985]|uniref:UDP-N-acetylglucosamine--N-acetylmuramyl-(pentapeptide) pyrophosphoryl-undecaprenol N-acetylglucosamine transferase n=1 Tax=Segniliparus rotundus (strain ATCC BAA-972 / CDC 1076 / CIP 108378 / DSM 44985 / JCM 13578) TaxID=640132 RepID=D6ZC48_SEGRD|nr:undecaprenyldiphospho-muramoylpentapeptide beta-N-acetylglucosaminyltransferase [Segniliparus rotundus]ADG99017.1 UDP-N-acetylglucosamine--N-acetylmuramyl- (pentapeptide) pyrophosphoryl-undecaprenol N- acetylglucosamine transferase [Segniliparus rotundus DSM 44985]